MKLDRLLQPLPFYARTDGLKPLRLVWDSETGALDGPDRGVLLSMIPAERPFYVALRVPPDSEPLSDPLKVPAEMAVLLGSRYLLPAELEALYPEIPVVEDGLVA